MNAIARLGAIALEQFRGWGHAAFFFMELLRAVPASLRRFGLVVAQVHAIGNRSLVIILASGLAVGFVLALQKGRHGAATPKSAAISGAG